MQAEGTLCKDPKDIAKLHRKIHYFRPMHCGTECQNNQTWMSLLLFGGYNWGVLVNRSCKLFDPVNWKPADLAEIFCVPTFMSLKHALPQSQTKRDGMINTLVRVRRKIWAQERFYWLFLSAKDSSFQLWRDMRAHAHSGFFLHTFELMWKMSWRDCVLCGVAV